MAAFDFDRLTLGEVAKIEQLSGFSISSLSDETPQGNFLAALVMVAKRRSGEPAFTFEDALNVPMVEAHEFLGLDDADAADDPETEEGKGEASPVSALA